MNWVVSSVKGLLLAILKFLPYILVACFITGIAFNYGNVPRSAFLDNLHAIIVSLCWFVPLGYVLNFLFNYIQIPFALLGKPAVFFIFTVKTYYLSLYCCLFIKVLIQRGYNINSFLVTVLLSLFLLLYHLPGTRQNDTVTNWSIILAFLQGVISVILIVVLPFFNSYILPQPASWYISFVLWLVDVPVIGWLLSVIFTSLALWLLWGALLYVIIFMLGLIRQKLNYQTNGLDAEEPQVQNAHLTNTDDLMEERSAARSKILEKWAKEKAERNKNE